MKVKVITWIDDKEFQHMVQKFLETLYSEQVIKIYSTAYFDTIEGRTNFYFFCVYRDYIYDNCTCGHSKIKHGKYSEDHKLNIACEVCDCGEYVKETN